MSNLPKIWGSLVQVLSYMLLFSITLFEVWGETFRQAYITNNIKYVLREMTLSETEEEVICYVFSFFIHLNSIPFAPSSNFILSYLYLLLLPFSVKRANQVKYFPSSDTVSRARKLSFITKYIMHT
jgi:hypothetical protein